MRLAPAIWLLMLASGFAGLGYQIIWTQQAALWLGHESAAVLAVVAAFFGGLALGAGALGSRIERSLRPARWYAACEAVIGLWALLLIAAMPAVSQAMLVLYGEQPTAPRQWTVAFAGCSLLLLPATVAMGATLPAMAGLLRQLGGPEPAARQGASLSIAGLYALNTLGGVVGVLTIAFWGVPEFGLLGCTVLCAGLNLACAAIALGALPATVAKAPPAGAGEAGSDADPSLRRRMAWLLACTGLLGIAYELTVVRVLSQVAEDTVYTFAMLLAVYLIGTAGGAAWLARWQARTVGHGAAPSFGTQDPHSPDSAAAMTRRLLSLLGLACLVGGASLWHADRLRQATAAALGSWMGADAGLLPALGAEAAMAVIAFALPTMVMGALFSHLATRATASGLGLGRALAVNTLGAALAPLVVGVGLLPAAGAKTTLVVLVVAYAMLALAAAATTRRPAAPRTGGHFGQAWGVDVWLPAAAAGVLAVAAPPLVFVSVPDGGRLVDYREGVLAAVSVTDDRQEVRRLHINNRQQEGSSHSLLADGRQALLPLLLHPAPKQVLFLGLGTGLTASAAAQDSRLVVEAVELLPEVAAAASLFHAHWADPTSASRLQTTVADARRHVRSAQARYDVIVADNVHPARSGTGSLYTVEHFQAVRARLAPDGLFCQWLPLHQMDRDTLASIVAAFRRVWPQGVALLATHSLDTPTLGLLGQATDGRGFSVQQVQARLAAGAPLPLPPADFGLHDAWAVLGAVVAGPSALARLSATAVPNTDDRPVVAYRAPRATYAPEAPPRDRLLAVLAELSVLPGELLVPGDAAAEPRLAAYRTARDQFLAAGRSVRPVRDARQMLDQVGKPLLTVLQTSPDFRPAFDPLLAMAQALATDDPTAARTLLQRLTVLQPGRADAASALQRVIAGEAAP